jgi:Cellulase (glycosyl hydrolase family 5)
MKGSRFTASAAALVASSAAAVGCGAFNPDVVARPGFDASASSDAGISGPLADDGGALDDAFVTLPPDDAASLPGLGSDGGVCHPNFTSGVNVAWVRFAADVPNPQISTFQTLFQNVHAAGGRVVRWWFHTNGTVTPGYDANGMAQPISSSNIGDVRAILDAARAAGVMVIISLWSFDMLKATVPMATLANNVSLLTVDANRQAYVTNVLTPLVTALAHHPGLYAWETFNEPEGMVSGQSWRPFTGVRQADGGMLAGQAVDLHSIQRTVNWFAAAIHDVDPSALVTNGTWEFQASANLSGMMNVYSDSQLNSAGGKSNGTLDFYEVHYYASNGAKYSPFANPAAHWLLDKPTVIGEFYALDQDGVLAKDTYTALHTGGYSGAWAWQYLHNDGNNSNNGGMSTMWPTMQVPLQTLYASAPNDVDCP